MENQFLRAALWYARPPRGWRVFPAKPQGKTPLIKDWPNKASTDPAQIRSWWSQWPNANVAIATGREIEVLDVDYSHGGAWSLRSLREAGDFPETPAVETGNGCHLYFKPSGEPGRNRAALLPGLDWRGEGGYVIAPPSVHPNGLIYLWGIRP